MAEITMPQLGETVTEGTIVRWHKQVGDKVEEDEVLFEVSSDKVDSEVPSAAAGYLAEILVQEGQTVEVGARLAVISDQPPGAAGGDEGRDQTAATAGEPHGGQAGAGDESAGPTPPELPGEAAPASAELEPAVEEMEGPPPAGDGPAGDGGTGPQEAVARPRAGDGGEARRAPTRLLSPVVRRLIAEHGLDESQIPGTGQGGRVTRSDVLAYIDRGGGRAPEGRGDGGAQPRPAPAAVEEPPGDGRRAAPAAPAATAGAEDEVIPFSNIRRRTAEHMVMSKATSPHVLAVIEVDFENVDRVRRAAREEFRAKEGFALTYLPFVCRALVDAIERFPHVNASVGDDELIVHRRVHLGIAVDLNFEGLIVPVVHDADTKRLRALARDMAELAARARAKKLSTDDISGGTFTVTNPGTFGTLLTYPVINQPQVAILATDGVKKRPVAVPLPDGGDGIAVHPVGNLALSFDHRAFDGAYASAFLASCKEILEQRDWAGEL